MPTVNVPRVNYRLTGGLLDSGNIGGGSVNSSASTTGFVTVAHGLQGAGPSACIAQGIVNSFVNIGELRMGLYGSDTANVTFAVSSMLITTIAVTTSSIPVHFNWIAIR